ncbi:ABC transporter substrate-binding protein [Variovorax sp. ZT5P49]|uniref:ABC transporter substrate-binding protein n=1 Tax=Variovorax sp. ZT5P49 TaxID=3443733 RepID=UPI003F45A804
MAEFQFEDWSRVHKFANNGCRLFLYSAFRLVSRHNMPLSQTTPHSPLPDSLTRRSLLVSCATATSLGLVSLPGFAKEKDNKAAVVDDTIVIGQSAPFSGPSAQLGTEFNLGARICFQMINEGGGIHGRKIELHAKDDAYDPQTTASNTAELLEQDRAVALFGYVGTSTTLAALPLAVAAQVPFFAPVTGAEALRQPFNRVVFNVRASYFDEAEYILDQLSVTGMKSFGVFHQNDAYGKAGLDAMTKAKAKRNLAIVATATVERHSTDVGAAAKALQAARPDAVVLISSYTSSATLIKEMKKAGYTGQFVSVSFVGGKALADELGSSGAGVMISEVVPFPWGKASPLQNEYARAMQKAGVPQMSFGSMEGFLAAKTLAEGLRRTGRDLTRARLTAALETMGNWDAGGFTVSFTPDNHNGSRFVEMTMIGAGGRFVH